MSEVVRARLLLAQMGGDTEPCIVAAVDEALWEHWDDAAEAAWLDEGKRIWGDMHDSEFKIVWAEFAPGDLVDAFKTPTVEGTVTA